MDPNTGIGNLIEQVEELALKFKNFQTELNELQKSTQNTIVTTAQQRPIEKGCYNWKVQIRNGYFSIDTGIKCLSDLLSYQKPISYLSPYNIYSENSSESSLREEGGVLISFKTREYGSLYGLTGKILANRLRNKMLESPPLNLGYTSLGLHATMNQLIDLYFKCHNLRSGIVHEVSFRKNLERVKYPCDDLVSVTICGFVCSTPCQHLDFSSHQRRAMSDFFYEKTKEIILDQFDDPDKKTENVASIILLYQYMHMTLKFIEYDFYINMAYQICLEMKAHYNRIGPQNTIEYALFTRNLSHAYYIRMMLDCVTEKTITRQPLPFPRLVSIPDEPEAIKSFLNVQGYMIFLYCQPTVNILMEQMHLINIGSTCTVNLEVLLGVDEIISGYRQTIPGQSNFCKDIYNEQECKKEIDESTDFFTIYIFIYFSIIGTAFHASFLQPVTLNKANEMILNIIRQKYTEKSQKITRLVFHGIKKIFQFDSALPCQNKLAVKVSMLYMLDTLILQCSADMNSEARQFFYTGLKFIEKIRGVKKSDLPPFVQMPDCDIREFILSRKADLSYYINYPDPWFALMYDLSQCL